MNEHLTPMQGKILRAMERDGPAAFDGEGSRKFGFGILAAKYGGIVIRAYGLPEWFLASRGLIERRARNVPGTWFAITDKGKSAIGTDEQSMGETK